VDGRTEATGTGDSKTNTLLGSLPVLLHPDPESVLVIGLGSGVTLGAVLAHPVRKVECAELSEGVVAAAAFFEPWHGGALADPRVTIRAEDGRNHLLLTRARYDVIVSQPSNMWAAGVGNLFTREFFELCRDRLAEDGILGQWIQGYAVSEETLRSVMRTISETFPSVDVWVAEWSDVLVVASKRTGPIDAARITAAFGDGPVGDGLRRAGIPDAATLLSHFMLDTDAVRRFSASAPLHTDDDRRVEMREPRALADGTAVQQAGTLLAWQADVRSRLSQGDGGGQLVAAVQARRAEIAARTLEAAGRGADAVLEFRRAVALNPADVAIRRNLARHHVRMGVALGRAGDLAGAAENFTQAVLADSVSAEAHANLGLVALADGRDAQAVAETERAIALDPVAETYLFQLGEIHRQGRRLREAADAYRRALDLRPGQAATSEKLAECLERLGDAAGAEAARAEAR
jgi:spermidine synthase